MRAHHRDLIPIVELQIRQVAKLFRVRARRIGLEGSFSRIHRVVITRDDAVNSAADQ